MFTNNTDLENSQEVHEKIRKIAEEAIEQDKLTEEQEEKLAESLGFARRWHKQANGRIQTMLAPHAPYTCPPDYI